MKIIPMQPWLQMRHFQSILPEQSILQLRILIYTIRLKSLFFQKTQTVYLSQEQRWVTANHVSRNLDIELLNNQDKAYKSSVMFIRDALLQMTEQDQSMTDTQVLEFLQQSMNYKFRLEWFRLYPLYPNMTILLTSLYRSASRIGYSFLYDQLLPGI